MKRGFTLIELIVTIGLVCIIGTIIVANLSNNLSEQQDKQYKSFKETLENAACSYIELSTSKTADGSTTLKSYCKQNRSCTVTIGKLYQQGLIEDKDLQNPLNKENISQNEVVTITYVNGVKSCKYSD